MLYLLNNCRASEPKVTPANWKRVNASVKKDWQIWYRFYDPRYKEAYPKGKLVPIRKYINDSKDLPTRQGITERLLREVRKMLVDGYNPHDRDFMEEGRVDYLISPRCPLISALEQARDAFANRQVYADLKSALNRVTPFFQKMGLDTTAVCEISRRHIKALQIAMEKSGEFSNKRINKLREYLSMMFTHLVELEAIEANPCRDIKPLSSVTTVRQTMTLEQRRAVHDFLQEANPLFLRFMLTFFHSGARKTEILKVRRCDVDLKRQQVKYTINKGGHPFEEWRPIKDCALPHWTEVCAECRSEDDYLFSEGLTPGPKSIRPDQINRRWRYWVKSNPALNITADFYTLKHSNLDEITAMLNKETAARMAAHTSTRMIEEHYAVGEKEREMERLKRVGNSFTDGMRTTIPLPVAAPQLRAEK